MGAWGKDQGIEDSMITFIADPTSALTKAVGMEMTHEGPVGVGLIGPRCKRHAMWVVDGEVKAVAIAESEFDPAGDDFPEKTLAPALIKIAKED
jgi:peroxiredoxin